MQKITVPINSFQFGEVSPSLLSRIDSPIYNSSAQKIENLFLRSEGGVIKRAGLKNIYRFSDITVDTTKKQQSRLLPFIFSDDEQYVISLEHQKVRCFFIDPATDDVTLVDTITQDVDGNALKFDDDYLREYTFAQEADVMFICHNSFVPQQIVRTGLTSFEVSPYVFDTRADNALIYQPYYNFHSFDTKLDPAATTGSSVTVTTTKAYFDTTGTQVGGDYPDSKHVGLTLKYHDSEMEIISVQSSTQATVNIIDTLEVVLPINSFRSTDGSSTIEVTYEEHGYTVGDSITISDCGGFAGLSSNQINGVRTVTSVRSDKSFTFNAASTANASIAGGGTPHIESHAPSSSWYEQSFSALRGYPAAITFHENRLVFAGTIAQPDSIWFSKQSRYYNFDLGDAEAADSIHVTASLGEVNQIRHLVSNRDLQVFTASSEMYVPSFEAQPLTPTNVQVKRQTPFGIDYVRPQLLDGASIFVQTGGNIIREYIYTDTEAAYTSVAISGISSHLVRNPIEMNTLNGAVDRSESYLFMINDDGKMAVFNSNRAEKRAGWVEFSSQGRFHSSVTVDEKVFVSLVVDIGDGTENIVLCQLTYDHNMDYAKDYTGTAGVFDVSADFADGAVVNVVNGNNYVGEFTVASGNVDVSAVDPNLTAAEIGYKFDVNLITNPIDVNLANGPATGRPRALASTILDLNNTLSISVNNTNLVIRQVRDDLSQQLEPFTGKKEFRLMGYSRDPQIRISQSAPLPLQVNGLVAELVL